MTTEWPSTLNSQKYTEHTRYLTWGLRHIFVRFTLWSDIFEIQCWWKSEVHKRSLEWPWTLNSQKYPLSINYIPPGPTFCSMTSCCQDTRLSKIEKMWKALNYSNSPRRANGENTLHRHKLLASEAQILVRFALRPSVFNLVHCIIPLWLPR